MVWAGRARYSEDSRETRQRDVNGQRWTPPLSRIRLEAEMSRQMSATTEQKTMTSPGVVIPPPVVYAAALGVAWLLQRVLPLPVLARSTALWVGVAIAAVGVAFAGLCVATLLRGHGTLNTNGRSAALVVTGVYRLSRNPMYVAVALMYTGAAVALDLPWGIVLLPLLLIYTQTMVIAREERYLAIAFGQQYADYRAHVRRWL